MGRSTCAVVICHGQSEYQLVQAIKSKLRLNIEIFARSKGRTSIQLDKLPDIFENHIFRNVKSLIKQYGGIESKKKEIIGCKIFTLMDLDDCNDHSVLNNYMQGSVSNIGPHQLKPYIYPIYFKDNLEDALRDIDFPFVAKNDREKHNYIKIFDPETGVMASESSITDLQRKFSKSDKSNIDEFLQYCLDNRLKF